MKKTLFLLGLFILSMTTILSSCDKSESDTNDNGGSNNEVFTNTISIGSESFDINYAVFYVDNADNDLEMSFDCNDLTLSLELDGLNKIPTGTFELTREGKYTAEVDMLLSDDDYDVTGALTISESLDTISVTISGKAHRDRKSQDFTLSYRGEMYNVNK